MKESERNKHTRKVAVTVVHTGEEQKPEPDAERRTVQLTARVVQRVDVLSEAAEAATEAEKPVPEEKTEPNAAEAAEGGASDSPDEADETKAADRPEGADGDDTPEQADEPEESEAGNGDSEITEETEKPDRPEGAEGADSPEGTIEADRAVEPEGAGEPGEKDESDRADETAEPADRTAQSDKNSRPHRKKGKGSKKKSKKEPYISKSAFAAQTEPESSDADPPEAQSEPQVADAPDTPTDTAEPASEMTEASSETGAPEAPTSSEDAQGEAEQPETAPAPVKKHEGPWYIPQPFKEISIPRKLVMGGALALFIFSLLPLFVGVFTVGIIPMVCIAAFFFLCALYWDVIVGSEKLWVNAIIGVVAVLVLAGTCYLAFVSGKMISASAHGLPEDYSKVTVVVLGCKINGDRPSRMLKARLDVAAEFLLANPGVNCIVTGGKGEDEDYPEAYIMKKYLEEKGVSSLRIITEETSTSTDENVGFALKMAETYNCYKSLLIVTDRFHQYRAIRAANDLGAAAYALNTETVWYLAVPYWFREMACITRDWLTA